MTDLYCPKGHSGNFVKIDPIKIAGDLCNFVGCRDCSRLYFLQDCTEKPEKKSKCPHNLLTIKGFIKTCDLCGDTSDIRKDFKIQSREGGLNELLQEVAEEGKDFNYFLNCLAQEETKKRLDIEENKLIQGIVDQSVKIAIGKVIEALDKANEEFQIMGFWDRGLFLLREKLKEPSK